MTSYTLKIITYPHFIISINALLHNNNTVFVFTQTQP